MEFANINLIINLVIIHFFGAGIVAVFLKFNTPVSKIIGAVSLGILIASRIANSMSLFLLTNNAISSVLPNNIIITMISVSRFAEIPAFAGLVLSIFLLDNRKKHKI